MSAAIETGFTLIDGKKALLLPRTTMTVSVQGKTFRIKEKNFWDSRLRKNICGGTDEVILIPKESVPELTNLTEDGTYLGKTLYCAEPMNP